MERIDVSLEVIAKAPRTYSDLGQRILYPMVMAESVQKCLVLCCVSMMAV